MSSNPCLLDQLLQPSGISTVFQPIVERHRGVRLHALECLSRGPRGTSLEPPDVLFDYVRLKNAEILVDRACIVGAFRSACDLAWIPRLSINVHASTLCADPGFPSFLAQSAEDHSISLEQVIVEIIEHSPASDLEALRRALEELRQLGAHIALDDVGLGYSSYQMLLECRPDYYKIDRYLVQGCHVDPDRRALLDSIVFLADRLGARVVAEGIEDGEELMAVTKLGIDLVQGHFFSRALSAADLDDHRLFVDPSPRAREPDVLVPMAASA